MSNVTTSKSVRSKVNSFKAGQLIDYKSLGFAPNQMEAVAQALSRLCKSGEIQRLRKGVFYKPQKTPFGFLQPSENTILQRYLKDGYITGVRAYNQMGLTTQTPYVVKVATNGRKSPVKIGGISIQFVESKAKISNNNKQLLPMLDAIKDIKRIPDSDINISLQLLANRVKKLDNEQRELLAKTALNYNASTRAITGAILENIKGSLDLLPLKQSLNPLTKYKLGVDDQVLPNKSNWNIV